MPEEETKPVEEVAAEEPKGEEKAEEAPKPETYDGVVTGKYQWDKEGPGKKDADDMAGQAITKYAWSDGKKTVSVYVELPGLDDVPEDKISVASGEKEASLTIEAIGTPPKKRSLALKGLSEEIDGAKFTKKTGKNTVVLKMTKKEEKTWYQLLEKSSGGGGGDDDDEGGMGGGMGGMGGGGMGGMDMSSMMQGMGGMGGMGGDMGF
mmetsp:Transcript_34438/g.67938  ORF Transcript_34438/g.67938 Transcript_34438/m.67938 type:complete len:207 (-) Transcript_34438:120-740(-)|eukprot:CAMPEP_0172664886 /NCGR_PEP_ID=MMETSP1074-20121228/6895_1 /TAXON_ID=2916 /ORGANISM="Ceratium fusus, Strain PA161109" /LENGTH=206 /DNA_ID=CAMNT_0013481115 /DNA_START=70 /DNA_END=690 /DNA_ORIENTATION=-